MTFLFGLVIALIMFTMVLRSILQHIKTTSFQPKEYNVIERHGSVGVYNGDSIPAQIVLEDGRTFEYDSLAAPVNGIYIVDQPELAHIRVNDFIYCQIKLDK